MDTNAFARDQRQLFGHPIGLYILFMTELWERFSYYGMRAILVLYMAESAMADDPGLGYTNADALALYGWYTMLVYVFSIPGGILADKFIGQKRSVMVGALLLVAGHGTLAIPVEWAFFLGCALIILGVGALKPNISTMVGGLYKQGDARRDQGFYIFYIGINVGAFLSSLVVAVVAKEYGWHYGFGLAGIGMLIGLVVYILGQRYLEGIGEPPVKGAEVSKEEGTTSLGDLFKSLLKSPAQLALTIVFAVGAVVGSYFFLGHGDEAGFSAEQIAYSILGVFVSIVIGMLMMVYKDIEGIERDRFLVLLLSFLIVIVFWGAFEQAGGLMNLYTEAKIDRNVSLLVIDVLFITGAVVLLFMGFRDMRAKKDTANLFIILGVIVGGIYAYLRFNTLTESPYEVPTGVFQSVNAFFIMIFATVIGAFWIWWQKRGFESSSLFKMAVGTIIMGAGFLFMAQASRQVEQYGDKAALSLLVLAYLLHTIGELCASPVALSFITKLAPVKYVSLMMGVYFAMTGFGNKIAGSIGENSQAEPIKMELTASAAQITPFIEDAEADSLLMKGKNFEIVGDLYDNGGEFVLEKGGTSLKAFVTLDAKSKETLMGYLEEYPYSASDPLTAILRFEREEKKEDLKLSAEGYKGELEIFEVQDDKEFWTFLGIFIFTVAFSVLLLLFLRPLKRLTHDAERIKSEEELEQEEY
ncbi:MAG: peptide MFS transporter [Bacteroidia bacterium]|nr:peptide MFS transporter [Bacteroidia bacterium]